MFRSGVDYAGRAAVLCQVLARHFWLFAIPLVIGLVITWRRARGVLVFGAGYAAVLFFVQFGIPARNFAPW